MKPKSERERMVERQLRARGIRDELVLDAFRVTPREDFVPAGMREFAYADSALPIGDEQTISQPYVVALTMTALRLTGGERVLEIGTGSGYAAAVLSRVASEVFSVERIESLAAEAKGRLAHLGYTNVRVLLGDGTLGWNAHAPYDAIAVAAWATEVPKSLRAQLAIGGRLVIPVGAEESLQVLMRITRLSEDEFDEEPLEEVRFVPLVNDHHSPRAVPAVRPLSKASRVHPLAMLIRELAEPITEIGGKGIDALIERIGDARVVLLGEATHGTSEFYRMRAHITRELILRGGFNFVAVEADWPDASRIDDYVRGTEPRSFRWSPFSRFPTWMWRNQEFADFVEWLRSYNAATTVPSSKVAVHGLDLYSLFTSINAVLEYLDRVDPAAARVARVRYGRLTPWQKDPAAYGLAVLTGKYESSESDVTAMLQEMLGKRSAYAEADGQRFFDAAQNAKVVAAAEQYYRAMYYAAADSWNLRDRHMFETLESLFALHGPNAKAIVWEHNSHVGDASATEMALHGELNIGQLCRRRFGDSAFLVGFGTDHGTVAAASDWGEPMQTMRIRPSHRRSYEHVFHESGVGAFLLALRSPVKSALREELLAGRLERAIGVVYRPETEIASHYLEARLPEQFDEYVWFDETTAILPLRTELRPSRGLPETYPFGL